MRLSLSHTLFAIPWLILICLWGVSFCHCFHFAIYPAIPVFNLRIYLPSPSIWYSGNHRVIQSWLVLVFPYLRHPIVWALSTHSSKLGFPFLNFRCPDLFWLVPIWVSPANHATNLPSAWAAEAIRYTNPSAPVFLARTYAIYWSTQPSPSPSLPAPRLSWNSNWLKLIHKHRNWITIQGTSM